VFRCNPFSGIGPVRCLLRLGLVMRRLFVALTSAVGVVAFTHIASAADLGARVVYKAPPPSPPLLYNWTGCYIGVEGGGNWGRSSQVSASGPFSGQPITGDYDLSGGLVGGTVGCNYQFSNFVIGIENDYSWTDKSGSHNDIPPFNTTVVSSTKEKWLDTLRGRAGFAWDRFFLYGTGGGGWAGTDVNVSNPTVPFSVTDSQTRTGWVAGVGGEWAAWIGPWGSLTFKVEYLHADLGTGTYIQPPVHFPGVTVDTRDVKLTDDIVRAGMNWKFNWGSAFLVPARY
jgi:outer membrane immunogenic protein